MFDIGYSELWFTWERGNSPETNIRERLDKGVTNVEWLSWTLKESFEAEVRWLWESSEGTISYKLENIRFGLRRWENQVKQVRPDIKEVLSKKLEMLLKAYHDEENLNE